MRLASPEHGLGFISHDAGFASVLWEAPQLVRVVGTDAHEGPVYLTDDDALYFTTLPRLEHRPGGLPFAAVSVKRLAAVAFTQLVTVLPSGQHRTERMRIGVGAYWPYLCDSDYEVQTRFDIHESPDPHHRATVPHTLVLGPDLSIDKVYVGYWFWGRPSPYQLWMDLQDLTRRTKADYDPTLPEVKAAWERQHRAIAASR